MSFSVNLMGHVDQALPDAAHIEQSILNDLEGVVHKYEAFFTNSSFVGSHANSPDMAASATAGGTVAQALKTVEQTDAEGAAATIQPEPEPESEPEEGDEPASPPPAEDAPEEEDQEAETVA